MALSVVVLVAACKADSPPRTVTYSNDEALADCDRLDDKANELGRKAALGVFSAESGVRSRQWEVSRASRCEGRILVRILVGDGSMKLPFFVQMDESFSNTVLQRPE
ncbi:hypothetical protein [Steroidobacter cummioxidans]|uniref:hypothetical protein n=1 Tax=Steroidobacter cummioxidans TaxID=1803913 RepID=UPI0012903DAB|nr:hypothetical protein [Steroidobacter cummioxidans]